MTGFVLINSRGVSTKLIDSLIVNIRSKLQVMESLTSISQNVNAKSANRSKFQQEC